jgi:hypothetical protein
MRWRFSASHDFLFGLFYYWKERVEVMSGRSYDYCSCGHIRGGHDDFDGKCEKCRCDVFRRSIRIRNRPAQ